MAATNEKTEKLLARLTTVTSGDADMAMLIEALHNLVDEGDKDAENFLETLGETYSCQITFEFPQNPVKIRTKDANGFISIEPQIYEHTAIQQWMNGGKTTSPGTRSTILEIITPQVNPKEFKTFCDDICTQIRGFFSKKNINNRKLKASEGQSSESSAPPRFGLPSQSPLEEQNTQLAIKMVEIAEHYDSIKRRFNIIKNNMRDYSLDALQDQFQCLFSESSILNPKFSNLIQKMLSENSDLLEQLKELQRLFYILQEQIRAELDLASKQLKTAAHSPSPRQGASPSSAMHHAQPAVQLQQGSLPPATVQQYQPVSPQSQLGFAAHVETSADRQAQIQALRLQIITAVINRSPLLKQYFCVEINNGQITIIETPGLNLTGEDYDRLHQTLRGALNNIPSLSGISWTLDTKPMSFSGQTVQVNRLNLSFPQQDLALQQQYQQTQQQHYPAAQQQYPAVSFFPPAYSHYQAGVTLQPEQSTANGNSLATPPRYPQSLAIRPPRPSPAA